MYRYQKEVTQIWVPPIPPKIWWGGKRENLGPKKILGGKEIMRILNKSDEDE